MWYVIARFYCWNNYLIEFTESGERCMSGNFLNKSWKSDYCIMNALNGSRTDNNVYIKELHANGLYRPFLVAISYMLLFGGKYIIAYWRIH